MMGMTPADGEFDRSTWLSRIHADDRIAFETALAGHLDGLTPQFQHEFRVILPDGTLSHMLARGMAVRDASGHPRRIAGSLADISELKRRTTELAAMAERLTIAHREAEEGRIEAETASRAKSEFLALVSHELRTPLNAILGFSDMMNKQIFGPIENARYRAYLADIQSSGEHLLQLINSILDYSKAAAGRLELVESDVDASAMANACVRLLKPQATAREIAVTLVMPPRPLWLRADETRLKQMILNLLSNGIKFTEKGGRVRVALAIDRDGGQTIEVNDTGIGMSAEAANFVFEPFRQVQGQHVCGHEGTGLGLPITKHLIELHGGSIELETEIGVGTTATLRFPPSRTITPPAQKAVG
jgi:signal transduction histidine kinase